MADISIMQICSHIPVIQEMLMLTLTNIRRLNSTTAESITIENGLIKGWNLAAEGEILDGNGATVAPALLELHAHLREPGQEAKEDLASGLAAAAAGATARLSACPTPRRSSTPQPSCAR